MPLVDWEIEQAIDNEEIVVNPLDKSLIGPNSLDLRLGGNFSELSLDEISSYIDPRCPSSFKYSLSDHIYEDEHYYILKPGGFILASLLEDITLSDSICAEIRGKSSLGRLGLDNSSVAGWVDSSWSGVLTIELSNHGPAPIYLTKGMKIGQMVFHKTERVAKGYDKTGRYFKQMPGAGSLGV